MALTPADLQAIANVVQSARQGWLPPYRLGEQLQANYYDTASVNNNGVQIVQANPNRVLLIISQPLLANTAVAPVGPWAASRGIAVNSGTNPLILNVNLHGVLPQLAWQVVQFGAGGTWSVTELIWSPPGGIQ